MNVCPEIRYCVLVLIAATLVGCSARENHKLSPKNENAAALAPVPADELPQFTKISNRSPLHVGITGQPNFRQYDVDLKMDLPKSKLTPAEQAEYDRLEREKFTYDYLDLADIRKPNYMVNPARGGAAAEVSTDIATVGVLAELPVSTRSSVPAPAPNYSPAAVTATTNPARGGANAGYTESTRSALQISPATTVATVSD